MRKVLVCVALVLTVACASVACAGGVDTGCQNRGVNVVVSSADGGTRIPGVDVKLVSYTSNGTTNGYGRSKTTAENGSAGFIIPRHKTYAGDTATIEATFSHPGKHVMGAQTVTKAFPGGCGLLQVDIRAPQRNMDLAGQSGGVNCGGCHNN